MIIQEQDFCWKVSKINIVFSIAVYMISSIKHAYLMLIRTIIF